MTVETPLSLGDHLYALYVRESRLDTVCGACEGAKTFAVAHADGQVRNLDCGHCNGKGKLITAASRPVLDVRRVEVHRIRVEADVFGTAVHYEGPKEGRNTRPAVFSLGRTPASLIERGALRIAIAMGGYLPYAWTERKDAAAVVSVWQVELQTFFATRRRE